MNVRSMAAATLTVACVLTLASSAQEKKSADAKITLPKDPKAVVLSYDPGAGGFKRKGEAPYLKIQADGSVTITNVFNGMKKEAKLTEKQLDELLRFVILDKKLLDLTDAKMKDDVAKASAKGPFIAVGGAGTAKITAAVNGKKHEVTFRAASAYARAYPKAELVARFDAIEKRLGDYARSVEKGK